MIWLKGIFKKELKGRDKYPFNLGLIRVLKDLKFTREVTFLVGENGSGKSTLLEGIATLTKLQIIGEENRNKPGSGLAEIFSPIWSTNPHRGFFLTAEDFFGFMKTIRSQKRELADQMSDYEKRFTGYGRDLAIGAVKGQLEQTTNRYGRLETESHGEGFLDFFQSRLVPGGLYLMDEPEAALSPTRQLGLISLLKEMVEKDSQFIIATHSPILMAFPDAQILYLADNKIRSIKYDQVDHVTLVKSFLLNPQSYLRRL